MNIIIVKNILVFITAYLLGSIPTAVCAGKWFFGIDVRNFGSKNSGATNAFRVLGPRAGVPVLLIDALKGYVAVMLPFIFNLSFDNEDELVGYQLVAGAFAVIGHLFPVFAGFRGGKGIATLLGIMIALHYKAAFLSFFIFVVALFLTQYVSVSSMTAAFLFPFIIVFIFSNDVKTLNVFSFVVSALVFITHRRNIRRLIDKKEPKATFLFRDNKIEQEKSKNETPE
jgi:acyl phosphate:glycerol-3-phosphate acyltransferase